MRSLKSIAAVLASTGVLISFSCAIPDLEKKPKETDEGTPLPAESVAVLPSSTINPEPEKKSAPPPPNVDPSRILMYVSQPDDFFLFTGQGEQAQSCSISPAITAGLTLQPQARYCRLEGTPTSAVESLSYEVEIVSTDGSRATKNVQIEVRVPNPAILANVSLQSGYVGAVFPTIKFTNTGEDAITCFTTPRLPEGLSISVEDRTCQISGTPLVESPTRTFQVFARAADGSRAQALTELQVQPASASPFCPQLSNLAAITIQPNVAMTAATFTNNGAVAVSCKSTPALPAGLAVGVSGGSCRITGTPSSTTNPTTYTIAATGSDGTTGAATVQITVTSNTAPVLVNQGSFTLSTGVAINPIVFSNTGGQVTSTCTVAPALPAGLSVSRSSGTCRISGTPTTAQGATIYTVTGSGSNAATSSATVQIAINNSITTSVLTISGTFQTKIKNFGVAPGSPNTLYVVHWGGMVYKSVDAGTTWSIMCQSRASSEDPYYGNIIVSPGADATAYIASASNVDRIESQSGGDCPRLTRGINNSSKNGNFYAIAPSGRLYSLTNVDYSFSDDFGANWSLLSVNRAGYRSMAIDPFDNSRVLMNVNNGSPSSIDGFLLNGVTNLNSTVSSHYNHRILMHPTVQNFLVLGSSGNYSTDGGTTFLVSAARSMATFDAAGNAYRIDTGGSTVSVSKSTNITATTPTWNTLYTFNSLLNRYEPDIRISGNTIGVISDSRLFVSKDSGVSFSEVIFTQSSHSPRSPTVAIKDNAIYLYDQGTILRSIDNGITWSIRNISGVPTTFDRSARLIMNPSNTDHLYLFAEEYNSTYTGSIYSTTNGFSTTTSFSDSNAGWYSWASLAGISKADPNIFMSIGWGRCSRSTNGLQTYETRQVENAPGSWFVWYPNHEGHVSPWNSNDLFYVDTSNGILYRFNYSAGTNTNMNNLLSFTDPAGIDLAKTGPSSYELRVISRTGKLDRSTDGSVFTNKNSTSVLTSDNSLILKHAPHDTNLMVVAGLKESNAAYTAISKDGGANWQSFTPGCAVRDIAFSNTKTYIACDNNEKMRVFVTP